MALFEKPKRVEEKVLPVSGGSESDLDKDETKDKKIKDEDLSDKGGERIYVMPPEFREASRRKKKAVPLFVWLIVIVLICLAGAFYFYRTYLYQPVESEQQKKKIEVVEQKTRNQQPVKKLSKAQTVKAQIEDENKMVVSWAELDIPEGALDKDEVIKLAANPAPLGTSLNGYKIVAGFFNVSPADLMFNKAVTLTIAYQEDQVEKRWENNLTLGYLKNETLTPIKSSLDIENKRLSSEFNFLPSNSFAIVIEESKTIPEITEEIIISPQTPNSPDKDQDGLTDIEEELYSTNLSNPDTDGDGISDGKEVLNLTNPNSVEEESIAVAGLISVYTDSVFNYSFFYPKTWLAKIIPETDNREVMITTNTNEFFTITVADNQEKLSPLEWYKKQSPGTSENLKEIVVNGLSCLFSPDRLTIYIADSDRIYAFSYKIGLEQKASFKSTFRMMINSWQFIPKKQSREGALIIYPNSPTIYLIENGKKRAFVSGIVFESLGYKWEDVIEIPIDEEYPNGPIIEGSINSTTSTNP